MKFAIDSGLTERAIRYGQSFAKPSRKTVRIARAKQGRRIFEADELRRIIDSATLPLRAMILLGINGGLGQSDIAGLPKTPIDYKGGWLDYPRPKTGIGRCVPMWPKTATALRE